MSQWVVSAGLLHQVWSVSVDQGAQSQAALPGSSQVLNANATVTTSLFLTPSQQLIGLREGLCHRGRANQIKALQG